MATRWVFNYILPHGGKNADVSKKMLTKKVAQHFSSGNTLENVPEGLYNAFLQKKFHPVLMSGFP